MSGHSKWSTIKRKKGATDQARGKLFSKLSRAISMAAKTGGGGDPAVNYRLRMAIETARASNMPKENIDRAISKATSEAENLEEIVYEGFGPFGIGVLVEVATDNRNRTSQEVKFVLERAGGNLAGPGSVSHNFESLGELGIKKSGDSDSQMLSLIDLGIEDFEEEDDVLYAYVPPTELFEMKEKIEKAGFATESAELVKNAKIKVNLTPEQGKKVLEFLEKMDDLDDVQKVFINAAF